MKIAVISDTHIFSPEDKILKNVLSKLGSCDMILHAGDLVNIHVFEELNKIKKTVAVYGNMDSHDVKQRLPEKEIIEVNNFKIGLTHGAGNPLKIIDYVKNVFANDKVDVIVFGHTHKPVNEEIDGVLFFNPGSLTDKVFSDFNSYGILEVSDKITGKIIKI